jgi:hypothetical protein
MYTLVINVETNAVKDHHYNLIKAKSLKFQKLQDLEF